MIDPKLRETEDVEHVVVAVASSTSRHRAEAFVEATNVPGQCAAYGSYEDLVSDTNVDIIYVASPHSHHFGHAMLALEAGKHVLCEKSLTVNAAQARLLYAKAAEKRLFLLDAHWIRYFPLSIQVRQIVQSDEIGEVLRVVADTSCGQDPGWVMSTTPRKLDKALAGGALLECMCPLRGSTSG